MLKELRKYMAALAFLAVVALISIGVFMIGKDSTKDEHVQSECEKKGPVHNVEIQYGQASPTSIDAIICDQLTITNKDDKLRLVAFGVHSEHIYYDGIAERPLSKNQELTVTLSQKGTYLFHDHLEEKVNGKFYVR